MISPIERKCIKYFAVLYLWDLERKLHKDFGNPQMCICIFPYSIVFPSSIAKHSGLQGTAQLIWEVWLGVGWAHPPCSHTHRAPIGRFQVGHQKCNKLGFFLGVCGEPKWCILNLRMHSYSYNFLLVFMHLNIWVSHVMKRFKILHNIDWIFEYFKKLSIF